MASNKQLSLGNHPNSKLEAPAMLILGEKYLLVYNYSGTLGCFACFNLGVFCGPLFRTFVSFVWA